MFVPQGSRQARRHRRVLIGVAAASLAIAGCGSDAGSDGADGGADDAPAEADDAGGVEDAGGADAATTGGEVIAAIADFAFDPTPLEAAAGSTITWTNADGALHTVTGTGDLEFDSGNLGEGESFSLTVDGPGEFTYVCTIHSSMQGTIVVS